MTPFESFDTIYCCYFQKVKSSGGFKIPIGNSYLNTPENYIFYFKQPSLIELKLTLCFDFRAF